MQWMRQLMMFSGWFNSSYECLLPWFVGEKRGSRYLSASSHTKIRWEYSNIHPVWVRHTAWEYSVSELYLCNAFVRKKMTETQHKIESMFKIAPRDFWSRQSTRSDTKVSHVTLYLTSVPIYQEEEEDNDDKEENEMKNILCGKKINCAIALLLQSVYGMKNNRGKYHTYNPQVVEMACVHSIHASQAKGEREREREKKSTPQVHNHIKSISFDLCIR